MNDKMCSVFSFIIHNSAFSELAKKGTRLNVFLNLLAQTSQPAGTQDAPFWANPNFMLYAVLAVGIIFIFSSSGRATRQQEKKHKEMLANLKRGDRVQTIGGILGSVVEVRDNEVVVKIDESSNTKIRVVRDAIKRVSGEETETPAKQ
jgi:preprotein translocase subunit YajC